jgi:hypothetical protein
MARRVSALVEADLNAARNSNEPLTGLPTNSRVAARDGR